MHFLNWSPLLKKVLNYFLYSEYKKEDMSHAVNTPTETVDILHYCCGKMLIKQSNSPQISHTSNPGIFIIWVPYHANEKNLKITVFPKTKAKAKAKTKTQTKQKITISKQTKIPKHFFCLWNLSSLLPLQVSVASSSWLIL